jgi:3-deoxy-manno-octulosonate cytidylyltransferase (CMP-KDO synthetase)
MNTRCQIVIPARLASTRLPEKLLRKAGGKTILHHTFEAASRSSIAEGIVVAVDDPRIADEVHSFGGRWIMTDPACASGTDRIAEVAEAMPEVDVFVNVQGDEPEIDPVVIDLVASTLIQDAEADMSTAGTPIRDPAALDDPSCVKIVMALGESKNGAGQGRAVYFSRAAVPFARDGVDVSKLSAEPPIYWHHIGLYAYRREFLYWFAQQPPSLLEQTERLEQLRAIEAGKRIMVARVESATPGIDTAEDLDAFIQRQRHLGRRFSG